MRKLLLMLYYFTVSHIRVDDGVIHEIQIVALYVYTGKWSFSFMC